MLNRRIEPSDQSEILSYGGKRVAAEKYDNLTIRYIEDISGDGEKNGF